MDKLLLSNSAGEKSLTATAFIVGFIVVNVKLLLAGMTFFGITMSAFSGSEYGIAVGALGAIYVLRRNAADKNSKEG
jgi:hypothetical protein